MNDLTILVIAAFAAPGVFYILEWVEWIVVVVVTLVVVGALCIRETTERKQP